jgi:putative DNA primase/helicase
MLLGVENGVVDLRTGALLSPEPSMYITKNCNAAYEKDAECPKWLEFLDQIFDSDKDTIETIQRALGYTLTGMNTEETLFICVGFGSNGKSVFGNTVVWIMGGYAQSAPSSLLVARRADDTGARSDIATLAGCRYVGINELQAGDRLDEQVVKMLAGREPITSRFLYGEYFTFTPQFTPWLRTNHKPIITGTDDGIWRRLAVIPFERKFSDSEKDPHLEQKLVAERDGILAWMIEGCLKYLNDGGLKLSPKIQKAGASYRKESDILGEFLEERTEVDINGRSEKSRLYSSWQSYCLAHGYKHGSGKSFGDRLQERGYDKLRSNSRDYFVGLKLRDMVWS